LGAAALGDIGKHFPDTDAQYKNADSRELLRAVVALLRKQNYHCSNVDATIIAQRPKMQDHIPLMIKNIAADLDLPVDCVNVKATTTERLGFCGREEGIAAMANVLITTNN